MLEALLKSLGMQGSAIAAYSAFNASYVTGLFIGPLLLAPITEASGLLVALFVLTAILVVSAAAGLAIAPRMPQPAMEPEGGQVAEDGKGRGEPEEAADPAEVNVLIVAGGVAAGA
jgi:hypothetical protein